MPRVQNPKFIAVKISTDRDQPKLHNAHTVPCNSIMVRDCDNAIMINGVLANIRSYRILVPDMVMQVTFMDGVTEKTRVQNGDTFDLDTGLRIAIAKHCGRKFYNMDGIEDLAHRLSYLKCIDKMLKQVRKHHDPSKDVTADMLIKKKRKKNKAEVDVKCASDNSAYTETSVSDNPHVRPRRKDIKITRKQHSGDRDAD